MLLKTAFYILGVALLTSCGDNKSKTASNTENPFSKPSWYKRYVGTLGDKHIVLNLICGSDTTIWGNYTIDGSGELFDLNRCLDSTTNHRFKMYASPASQRFADTDINAYPVWTINGNGDSIKGVVNSNQGQLEIRLAENYTGAQKLGFIAFSDSVKSKDTTRPYSATCMFSTVYPTEKLPILEDSIYKNLVTDSPYTGTLKDYPAFTVKKYLADFNKSVLMDSSIFGITEGYYQEVDVLPIYNANNYLCLELKWGEYSGGAHGGYGAKTIIFDVEQKKRVHLDDIMTVDSVAISKLLDDALRKSMKVSADEPMSSLIFGDHVPATSNFMISGGGLTFIYSPYEIACFAAGEIVIYIPYSDLKKWLKPDFTHRMKIQ